MGFSTEWESLYKQNKEMSIWPWSDLISYVMRYTNINEQYKVLEIGCGAGANIPFFQALGVDYYAIEGSEFIVEKLHRRFPEYAKNIVMGDFTKEIKIEEKFDLVVDRAALTHNTTSSIKNALQIILDKMKNGGKYIGIDWFSVNYSAYQDGEIVEDVYTKYTKTGRFAGIGNVHFSNEEHLLELFKKFTMEVLEEKIITQFKPQSNVFAAWNFVAKKELL